MSQTPTHLRRASGQADVRDRLWAIIRKYKHAAFTTKVLQREVRCNEDTARDYLKALCQAGYLAITHREPVGGLTRYHYQLIKDVGIDTPRLRQDGTPQVSGQGRLAMWRAIKILADFSARELAVAASTDAHVIAEREAVFYLRYLCRARYVRLLSPGGPAATPRYLFLASRNTGPRAPMVRRVRQVFDPNLNKVVWSSMEAAHA